MIYKLIRYALFCSILLLTSSCSKFLDVRPDIKLVVPASLEDLQALLDEENMNLTVGYQILGSDEVHVTDEGFLGAGTSYFRLLDRNFYVWADNPYEPGETLSDWSSTYSKIFTANVVLERALKLTPATDAGQEKLKWVQGAAYFYRGMAVYELLQLFASPYDPGTASQQLGIPLRLSDNVLEVSERADLQTCYNQLFSDLEQAYALLPDVNPIKTRPSKLTIDALLARIYLSISDYNQALLHADKALGRQENLMDYNALDSTAQYVFPVFNPEVIMHMQVVGYGFLDGTNGVLYFDPVLFAAYDDNDLRKKLYFTDRSGSRNNPTAGMVGFTGYYSGTYRVFTGFATDELYLIKAECLARDGRAEEGLQLLNELLVTRWVSDTFTPYTVLNPDEILPLILTERRKQLVMRGTVRWTDLRRLNREPRFATTLTRNVAGDVYSLPPNDSRYTLLIPPAEIERSGIKQNER